MSDCATGGVSALERIEAILDNPALVELAALVPRPPRHRGGRPRHYPVAVVLVYEALISVFGSARQVEAELGHPVMWRWVRRRARRRLGIELPRRPIRRHHYLYLRNRYLTAAGVLEGINALHRHIAAQQALELGLLDPDGAGSWTHPSLDRLLYGDGKVLTPLYRAKPGDTRVDRATGELRPLRAEPDAALHFEGTGETAWGTKFVFLATRGTAPHSRVILDVEHVVDPGGEAATAMECLERTAPHTPGAQAVVYDTALRGVHHQTILRDLGLVPVNRVTAAKASATKARRKRDEQRTEKMVFVETKTITLSDGTRKKLDLYAHGGAIGLGTIAANGDLLFTRLDRVRTHRNRDKGGFRWYNDYRMPTELGGGIVTVRLHGDKNDVARKFNRTENVRPLPPDEPGFATLFRRRNDAESINRGLEDTLWIGRAHSVGHRRQLLNLLGYALVVNALALHRHRRHTTTVAP